MTNICFYEVYLIFRFLLWSLIFLEIGNLRCLASYCIFKKKIIQLSRSGSTKKVWYFKGFKIFLQIQLHVHFKANSKQIINLIQQFFLTKLSKGQQIQHFRTSNHSIKLLLYKYHLLVVWLNLIMQFAYFVREGTKLFQVNFFKQYVETHKKKIKKTLTSP